jgi:uncharacterized protein YdeI (YjbR/CyaY-like superfamily)
MAKTNDSTRKASASSEAELPQKLFASPTEWERWLDGNHMRSRGVWLKIAKRGSGAASVSYADALQVALLFGWIDGQKEKCDERFWLQKFTPRSPKSRWSQTNRASAARLIKSGRMRPAGLAAIEGAKADGRWKGAYAPQSRASVPEDLRRALDAEPRARAFFDALDGHNRYAILYRVQDAKKLETREKRIATFVRMLANGEMLHPKQRAK